MNRTLYILIALIFISCEIGGEKKEHSLPSYLDIESSSINPVISEKLYNELGNNITIFEINKEVDLIRTNSNASKINSSVVIMGNNGLARRLLFSSESHGFCGIRNRSEGDSLAIIDQTICKPQEKYEFYLCFQYSVDEYKEAETNSSEYPEDFFSRILIYQIVDGKLLCIYDYDCVLN